MKKKILALLLVMSLGVSQFCITFAEEVLNIEETDISLHEEMEVVGERADFVLEEEQFSEKVDFLEETFAGDFLTDNYVSDGYMDGISKCYRKSNKLIIAVTYSN